MRVVRFFSVSRFAVLLLVLHAWRVGAFGRFI